MVRYATGNILTQEAEALVNTVNCVGVMGRGVALQFKKAFPENFRAYAAACRRGQVRLGRVFVFETGTLANPRFILNFPTKQHWRNKSQLQSIDAGLEDLVRVIHHHRIRSLAVPPLGSGLGGLEWRRVRPRIEKALGRCPGLDAVIFEPTHTPAVERVNPSRPAPRMTPGRATLVGLMDRYLRGLLDPFITLLELHKLMYFMQVAGEDLRLHYTKRHYGPYAPNLRHVLKAVEGHFISGYGDGGDNPDKPLELVHGAVETADSVLNHSPGTKGRFERVVRLIEGFESAFGLELLATVHWVLAQDAPTSSDQLVERTYRWHPHKKKFSPRQIRLAATVLAEKGWVAHNAGLAAAHP